MKDNMKLPEEVMLAFLNGKWTVSGNGTPYHNQAIDEAHESMVNKRTKQLTSRPSEHHVISLANFMAMLDSIDRKLGGYVSKYSSRKSSDNLIANESMLGISEKVKGAQIFETNSKRKLCNVFSSKPPTLDNEQRKDLLRVQEEGKARMKTYIKQYIMEPPAEIRKKRIQQKLKTFSKPKNNIRQQQSKVSRLTKMTKKLAARLQQTGQFYDRILEYPLAICDELGKIRSRHKSTFKEALLSIPSLAAMFSTIIPFDIRMVNTESLLMASSLFTFLLLLKLKHMVSMHSICTSKW
jgi:hypothetical protein